MSYKAYIAPLTHVRLHSNADKIQLATVLGSQVIISLDHIEGELGVYFPPDGQLSHEMCLHNNLYTASACSRLGLPAPEKAGFFDHNRRVRAQNFRGEKSEGIWLPLVSLDWLDQSFAEGDTIDDPKVCQKMITKATRASGLKQRSTKRGETEMFRKHQDTEQFRYYWQDIPPGSVLYLTEKLHGTSGRYGLVLENTNKKWWQFWKAEREWRYLNGSRNVILEHSSGGGFYGTDQFRYDAIKDVTLHKGETIYFELVGDVSPGSPIMPSVDTKQLPEVRKRYGSMLHYRYGAKPGECKLFVYRITLVNEDGYSVDLSWPQVKRRAGELGLEVVPEVNTDAIVVGELVPKWKLETIKHWVEALAVGESTLDPSHIREGVCIRVETPDGRIYTLKEKSYDFKVLEGIVKLDDNYIDIEEAA